jgi:DNA-binding transcriptional regulator YiaG
MPCCHLKLASRKPRFLRYFRTITGYTDSPKSLSEHLRKRRIDLCLLQKDVANLLGVALTTYRNWETLQSQPSTNAWPRLIQFLGYEPRAK